MVDAHQDITDEYADDGLDVAGDDDGFAALEEAPAPVTPASAPVVESPLVKWLQAFGLAKKPAPADTAAPAAAAGRPAPAAAAPQGERFAPDAPPAGNKIPPGPLVTVVTRNEFYRDGFRSLIKIALVEAVIIVVLLVAFIYYIGTSESQDRFFATTADGRIIKLVPLDSPNMTEPALMSWVAQAAREVMTFGHHDYRQRLQQSSRHFTQRGWESFSDALNKSKIIDTVVSNQQVITASPRSAPTLQQAGVFNGRYRWVVNLPLQINFGGGGNMQGYTHNMNVTLVLQRVPSLENPTGVGIEQWISSQG